MTCVRAGEAQCHVVEIPVGGANGSVDIVALEAALVKHQHARMRIGSFSAASNITGVIEQVELITALLHKHGALSLWDYAAAGPHVDVNMNPPSAPEIGIAQCPSLEFRNSAENAWCNFQIQSF